jgi:hypothetical protein
MKNFKILISLLLLAIVSTSCDGWLNLTPTSGVARNEYWQSKEDVASFTTGIYSALVGDDVSLRLILWGEMRADMLTSGTKNNSNFSLIKQGEITSYNSYCDWGSFYTVINNCNTLIKYAPGVLDIDKSFTQSALQLNEAQAVGVRSLMYFYLIRNFGDIPYTTTAYVDDSQDFSIAKSDKDSVLNYTIRDMESVVEELPTYYSTSSAANNKGKFTRYAGYALLADMYLWKENYQKTVDYCDKIISSGQYALIPVEKDSVDVTDDTNGTTKRASYATDGGKENLFNKLYVTGNSAESIFELQFGTDNTNPFYTWFTTAPSSYAIPNTDFISESLFLPSTLSSTCKDIRQQVCSSYNTVWKYAGLSLSSKTTRTEAQMIGNLIVYRLAEVYLMRAEAKTQLAASMSGDQQQNELKEALKDVDLIRDRANAVDATDIDRSALSVSTLEEFILQEEAREFAFEGKRWYDVLRNAKRNNYANLKYLVNMCVYSTSADKVYSLQSKYSNNYNSHYLPIYYDDLQSNSLLKQNSFYGDGTTSTNKK